ncbi:helix-turn-helix domain-containing protein [Oceanobacillus piezotolerans]|uniref:Helix-turn-helix domain-containing protein n=1 Tax=Oceanobacillus piezotolerans TaxID=2448030 RepID=A0A498D9S6_9BACI|nr:helix-turn-helix domain-containing protein [Oceanobacillus piezotolerans]RLL45381.1 helix-turn-helix domain-containing protein [Oceanobacillus piezotolerans]
MDIGARLKEERLAKGLSLEELQDMTKIQKRYLVAIEEGRFEILPGKFYARAFIKEYANAVGIDSSELLEEHKEEIPKSEEESTVQYSRMDRAKKQSNSEKSTKLFSIFPTIIVILLVIGIIFVLWYFISQGSGNDGASENEQGENDTVIINNPDDVADGKADEDDGTGSEAEQNETAQEGEEAPAEEEEPEEETQAEFVVDEEGSGSSPHSTLTLNNAGEEVIITLEANEGYTWLDIQDASGSSLFSNQFNAEMSPHEIDASGSEQLYFNVGNAPALTIYINGVELEYPADISKVHQRLTININNEAE